MVETPAEELHKPPLGTWISQRTQHPLNPRLSARGKKDAAVCPQMLPTGGQQETKYLLELSKVVGETWHSLAKLCRHPDGRLGPGNGISLGFTITPVQL